MIKLFLVRLLISWWLIPVLWILFPMDYLMYGDFKVTVSIFTDFTKDIWNGSFK